MELKGSKTEKNLMEAFAGESMARNKYTFFASVAKKAGYEQLAAIFEETAGNEKEHAKLWFKALNGGEMPDVMTCLELAAGGEHDEWTDMYPRMAKEAKEEGFNQLAALFTMVGHWNSWFNAMIYLRDEQWMPLQMVLRDLLISQTAMMQDVLETTSGDNSMASAQLALSMRYALIIVTTLPIMCVYPFLQKYFVKGMTMGSVKG